jgi:hypothetical protein
MTPRLFVILDDEKGQQSHTTRDIYRLESNVLWYKVDTKMSRVDFQPCQHCPFFPK